MEVRVDHCILWSSPRGEVDTGWVMEEMDFSQSRFVNSCSCREFWLLRSLINVLKKKNSIIFFSPLFQEKVLSSLTAFWYILRHVDGQEICFNSLVLWLELVFPGKFIYLFIFKLAMSQALYTISLKYYWGFNLIRRILKTFYIAASFTLAPSPELPVNYSGIRTQNWTPRPPFFFVGWFEDASSHPI